MKHLESISKKPAMAATWPEDHPNLKDSISGFLEDPIGVLELHIKGWASD